MSTGESSFVANKVRPHGFSALTDSASFKPSLESVVNASKQSSMTIPTPPTSAAKSITYIKKETENLSAAEKLRSKMKRKSTEDEYSDSKEQGAPDVESSESKVDGVEMDIKVSGNILGDLSKRSKIENDKTIIVKSETMTEGNNGDDVTETTDEVIDSHIPATEGGEKDTTTMHEEEDLPFLTVVPNVGKADDEMQRRIIAKEKSKMDNLKGQIVDHIQLHEKGAKARYYGDKHKKDDIEKGGGLGRMCFTYIEGLIWIFKYYYTGCPSWSWYYPFHYAPFASDLVNVDLYEIKFEMHYPFRPIEQLLAVLPADSVNALPDTCHWLMTDKSSPIIDIYSDDIPIDPNGKHLPHLWVLLLPFLDEKRIHNAFEQCEDALSEYDKSKNKLGQPIIFVHRASPIASGSASVLDSDDDKSVEFDAIQGNGMAGELSSAPDNFRCPLDGLVKCPSRPLSAWEDLKSNQVCCFAFALQEGRFHASSLLVGTEPIPPELTPFDLAPRRPPRMNRGRFNIVDIATARKQQGARQVQNCVAGPTYGFYANMNMGGPRARNSHVSYSEGVTRPDMHVVNGGPPTHQLQPFQPLHQMRPGVPPAHMSPQYVSMRHDNHQHCMAQDYLQQPRFCPPPTRQNEYGAHLSRMEPRPRGFVHEAPPSRIPGQQYRYDSSSRDPRLKPQGMAAPRNMIPAPRFRPPQPSYHQQHHHYQQQLPYHSEHMHQTQQIFPAHQLQQQSQDFHRQLKPPAPPPRQADRPRDPRKRK